MMTIEEIKEYLANELLEEYNKMIMNQPNYYGYLFMITNDIGIFQEPDAVYNPENFRKYITK